MRASATKRRVGREFFGTHTIDELRGKTDYWLGQQGRITEPFVLREGATHYEPISWDAAFELVASKLRGLASPDEAIFYTSGRTSNEAAFLYQLLVRSFGTNNLPDCSNMCHESSGAALSATTGVGKGSASLADIHKAVDELRERGVVFEEYDMPQLKTVNGIAEIQGIKGAWFKDPDGNILSIGETT